MGDGSIIGLIIFWGIILIAQLKNAFFDPPEEQWKITFYFVWIGINQDKYAKQSTWKLIGVLFLLVVLYYLYHIIF
jgi:hypothetical protein